MESKLTWINVFPTCIWSIMTGRLTYDNKNLSIIKLN